MRTKSQKKAKATDPKIVPVIKLSKRMEAEMGAFIRALQVTPLRNTKNT